MKILLVNPPETHMIRSEVPRAVREEGGQLPPLGILYLHAWLTQNSNHHALFLDANLDPDEDHFRQILTHTRPDAVGITTVTHKLVDTVRYAAIAKQVNPHIHVVAGGPHTSIFPAETLRLEGIDSIVLGEGETALVDLLDALDQGRSPGGIAGVMTSDSIDSFVPRTVIPDLDPIPFPRRGETPFQLYYNLVGTRTMLTTVLTSRGCPYNCAFCSTPRENCRVRSPQNVVAELAECRRLGIEEIYFVDDTFNVYPQRVIEICRLMKEAGLGLRWSCRARVNTATPELLAAMKAAGCIRIQYGVETSSDEGMARLNKELTIEQVRQVFRWTRQAGIPSVAYFMIGLPDEKSEQDIRQTMRFAAELDPDFVLYNIFTPYPGTALYDEAVNRGILTGDEWLSFAAEPKPDFRPAAWTEHFDEETLIRLLDKAFTRFYWRPRVIWRNLRDGEGLTGLIRKARAAVKMLPILRDR